MNNTINYYELLGVKQNASEEEIKKAYKAQMKIWHPDINKSADASDMSTKINAAKDVLLDVQKRREYDEHLKAKNNNNYNHYTNKYQNSSYQSSYKQEYEDQKVTKWQYFFQWIKLANVPIYKKIFGTIGVLLESLLCSIINIMIIILAFISNISGQILKVILSILSWIFGLILILLVLQILQSGFIEVIKSIDGEMITLLISLVIIFILSILLPKLSELILSPRVFNYLYNNLNITLFKRCVGYKD